MLSLLHSLLNLSNPPIFFLLLQQSPNLSKKCLILLVHLGPYHLHGHELWCHLTLALISDEKVMQRRRGWALLFQMMYITSDAFSFFLKTRCPFLVLKNFCPNLLSTLRKLKAVTKACLYQQLKSFFNEENQNLVSLFSHRLQFKGTCLRIAFN